MRREVKLWLEAIVVHAGSRNDSAIG